jgi:putative protein kinase ArgK-like GTPase of G3E family
MPNYASGAKKKKEVVVAAGSDKKKPKVELKKKPKVEKGPKKPAAQVLAEYQASERDRMRKDREAREAIVAKAAERKREADLAELKRRAQAEKTVEQLDAKEDGPQTIADCVARTLGLPPGLLPKQVLAQVYEKMPGVALDQAQLPKAQLLQLVDVLVVRRAAKRTSEAEKHHLERLEREACEESARAQAEERVQAKLAESAAAKMQVEERVAEKLAALQLREPRDSR